MLDDMQDVKKEIAHIIELLQDEQEAVNGNDWQSGYNNGLARAVVFLCNLHNKIN